MRRTTQALDALEQAGHPVVRIVMKSIDHIGQEFFRFEMATAVAGAILGINPFNQPDVEDAKIKTRELTAAFEKSGTLPPEQPAMSTAQADLYTDRENVAALRRAGANGDLTSWLKAHLSRIDQTTTSLCWPISNAMPATSRLCSRCGFGVRDQRHVATCAEFGPRFLHSTGQAYKAVPTAACFCKSHAMMRGISRCRVNRPASG